jgi:hypothetical protein
LRVLAQNVDALFFMIHRCVQAQNIDALFFMILWARCGSNKKRPGTRYTKLVFLHHVRFVSHVVHSDTPGVRNVDVPFFMLGWAWCESHIKRIMTQYAELVFFYLMQYVRHTVHFDASKVQNSFIVRVESIRFHQNSI